MQNVTPLQLGGTLLKKLFALLLALVLVFPVFSAVAETATGSDVIEVPAVENGTVVPFADHNFQITLPSRLERAGSDRRSGGDRHFQLRQPGEHPLLHHCLLRV